MISIEECVNVTVHMLNVYILGSQERMLKAVNKENVLKEAEPDKDKTGYLKNMPKETVKNPLMVNLLEVQIKFETIFLWWHTIKLYGQIV